MSITDELRDCIRTANRSYDDVRNPYNDIEILHIPEEELLAIADRIDAEHEMATSEFWAKVNAVPATDENMAEHGWVRLPVDADGEVWHVGDFAVGEINPKNPKAIERMIWYGPDSGWQLETDTIIYPCPDRPRHYHTPTVEDVLREFTDAILEWAGKSGSVAEVGTWSDVAAEYVAKLRLAGDTE